MPDTDGHPESMVEFFDRFEAEVRRLDPGSASSGLSADEIATVAADQRVDALPAYFDEFLRRMGRTAGSRLWVGTCAFFPDTLGIKDGAQELLALNDEVGLMSEDAVVVALHQGYHLYWLQPHSGENPPVLAYVEGTPGISQRWESYTAFLEAELEDTRMWPPPLWNPL